LDDNLTEIANYLIENGANLFIVNSDGNTALMMAKEKKNSIIVEVIKSKSNVLPENK